MWNVTVGVRAGGVKCEFWCEHVTCECFVNEVKRALCARECNSVNVV